jgi:hypothetical protein
MESRTSVLLLLLPLLYAAHGAELVSDGALVIDDDGPVNYTEARRRCAAASSSHAMNNARAGDALWRQLSGLARDADGSSWLWAAWGADGADAATRSPAGAPPLAPLCAPLNGNCTVMRVSHASRRACLASAACNKRHVAVCLSRGE